MDVLKAISTRHSIRHYKSEPVAEGKINNVLEAARCAPSWANTQCCRFVVVQATYSLGLGTVHVGAFDAQKAAQFLNVPQGVAVVEMTPSGYSEKEGKAPPRKELSEMVFYESYGQKENAPKGIRTPDLQLERLVS